jgi:PAS domain S-box-containing protein
VVGRRDSHDVGVAAASVAAWPDDRRPWVRTATLALALLPLLSTAWFLWQGGPLRLGAAIAVLLAAAIAWGGLRLESLLAAQARALRDLEASDSHFRSLADNLPDVVARLDAQGRYRYVNAAVRSATGIEPGDFIGKTHVELRLPADQVARWGACLARVFASGRAERLEFSYPGPQGERQWESLVVPEPARAGAEPTVLVISRDITERQRDAQAREALNRRLASLVEGMSDGFVSLDRDWRYRYVNRKAGEMFGRNPDDLVGKHIWTELPEGLGQPFRRAYERAMCEGVAVRLEEYYRPWDTWFENRIVPSADGISIFISDIGDRKRREAELKQLHATLQALVDGSTDAIFVKDEHGRYLVANQAVGDLLGRPASRIVGVDDRALFPPEVAERFRADDRRVMQERRTETYEESVSTVKGMRSHLTTKGPLVIDGEVRGVFGISRDISERIAASARFERLFLSAPEPISLSDLDSGHFIQVNDAFCALFGFERGEVLGRTSFELNLWTQPQRRAEVVQRLREGLAVQGFEGRARHRSGASIDLLYSAERIEFGGRDCLLLMFRDVTERRRLESALHEREARLAELLRSTPAVIYTARPEGDYAATYYSPNLHALLGWQPEQFLNDPAFWLEHIHPDDRAAVLTQLEALHERDELVLEYRFRHADGRWRWMRDALHVTRDAQGAATELVGSWIDITERREAEDEVRRLAAELEQRVRERTAELARSEARYRSIFESVPVAIGEEDWSAVQRLLRELRARGVSDGAAHFAAHPEFVQQCLRAVRVVRLNQKALALHDAPGTVTGLETFYPAASDLPQFVGELEALWNGQRTHSAKKSLPSVAGRPLRLMLTMSLPGLDDEDGTALVSLVDITEIDRLNAELDRSIARLREANRELETFTYSVSHDLKAPLRGIDGYSRLLMTEHHERLDDEGRRFLANIRQATQHMGVLIDDLLAYSRLERRELTMTALPLAALVESVLEPYRLDFAQRGVVLELSVAADLRARGDAQGFTIALRNLIDNALKFSRDSRPPRLGLSATRSEGAVRLAVRDNGLGFDMKFHDRIFAIFQRLHRAEDYPGTGVGLAIVRKAMERMGGRVWADSAPGRGATFTLELKEFA